MVEISTDVPTTYVEYMRRMQSKVPLRTEILAAVLLLCVRSSLRSTRHQRGRRGKTGTTLEAVLHCQCRAIGEKEARFVAGYYSVRGT